MRSAVSKGPRSQVHLLVDVGDVLIPTRPHHRMRALELAGLANGHIEGACLAISKQFDAGDLTESEFLSRLTQLAPDSDTKALREAWAALVGRPDQELVNELLKHDDAILVSNTNPIDWAVAKAKLAAGGLARTAVLSFERGVVKPDVAFYRLAHQLADSTNPADLLFVDDQPVNVEAATAYGFSSHRHTNSLATIDAIRTHRERVQP